MIKTFSCKETEKIWHGEFSKKLPTDIQELARRKLRMIAASSNVDFLKIPPSNNLEKLRGNRSGQYSIRINKQWRVCFEWQERDAFNVEIVDYH